MTKPFLEHVNITVRDIDKSAATLCDLFDWKIRWKGDSIDSGKTVHVGTDDCYLALYRPPKSPEDGKNTYNSLGGLNHIAIVVGDINDIEARVLAAGFKTYNHASYEPGKRFYFSDADDIEFEIVSYL